VKIRFFGAAGEVTGSCHLLECGRSRVLVDCGLVQGSARDEARNREPFPFDPAGIDALVLTHAHLDHAGRIPQLVNAGFRGRIYTHRATRDLARIMLRDAASLSERDAQWENRKRERKGLAAVTPLYTRREADAALRLFRAVDYDSVHEVAPGVRVRLQDAGHILGSAIAEIWLRDGADERKLVFSGDLGHEGDPLLPRAARPDGADLVILESTYGDRDHRDWAATSAELAEVLAQAARGRGNILIPAFAVGRTQELLYLLGRHRQDWELDRWRVFLDSPMAIQASRVYLKHRELLGQQVEAGWLEDPADPFRLPNLRFTQTPAESMAINRIRAGALIIAGSGMCNGGRIRQHLKHNVWRRETHVVIVGYQAQGTLGRALVDGARHIRLWGETIRVGARIHTVGGLSAHAGQSELVDWYGGFAGRPPVALVHGEERPQRVLATRLRAQLGAPVLVPRPGEGLDLREIRVGVLEYANGASIT
jgi:metallo-beta-lactamase family protein